MIDAARGASVETVADLRASIVAEALSWLRTPYHHAARVKGAGVDCGQFVAAVFEGLGLIPRVEILGYGRDFYFHRDEERYLGHVEHHARRLELGETPGPGDVALYRYGRCVAHGAVVVEWPQIVHAYTLAGMVTLDDAVANRDLAERQAGAWTVF